MGKNKNHMNQSQGQNQNQGQNLCQGQNQNQGQNQLQHQHQGQNQCQQNIQKSQANSGLITVWNIVVSGILVLGYAAICWGTSKTSNRTNDDNTRGSMLDSAPKSGLNKLINSNNACNVVNTGAAVMTSLIKFGDSINNANNN